jgi:hypothetical protein
LELPEPHFRIEAKFTSFPFQRRYFNKTSSVDRLLCSILLEVLFEQWKGIKHPRDINLTKYGAALKVTFALMHPSGSINGGKFLEQLSDCQLVKKDSAPWD